MARRGSPFRSLAARAARALWERVLRPEREVIAFSPESMPTRGRVLFSYLTDPLRTSLSAPPLAGHPNQNRVRAIVSLFLERGYQVDAIDYRNKGFRPKKEYSIVFDIQANLFRLSQSRACRDAARILLSTCNPVDFHNQAERGRAARFRERYGVDYQERRQLDEVGYGRSLEVADVVLVPGCAGCRDHFPSSVSGKIRWLPGIPALCRQEEDIACAEELAGRADFLWLNGEGAIHKGADIVIEAFAGLPHLQLHMVGGCLNENDFFLGMRPLLSTCGNVHLYGMQDLLSPTFSSIADRCSFVVQPSCSEAAPTSTITMMHLGMVPIMSPDCCMVLPAGTGVVLRDGADTHELRQVCRELASLDGPSLRTMRLRVREYARRQHSMESMVRSFAAVLSEMEG